MTTPSSARPPGSLPSDPPDLDPAVRAFRLVLAASHHLRGAMDAHLRASGITTQQAAVMSILEAAERPLPLGEVASALGTSHQNARQIVDALARKGFVEVGLDDTDRRRRLLSLSEQARAFWADRTVDDTAVVTAWFAGLDGDERRQLADLLARLIGEGSALSGHEDEAAPR